MRWAKWASLLSPNYNYAIRYCGREERENYYEFLPLLVIILFLYFCCLLYVPYLFLVKTVDPCLPTLRRNMSRRDSKTWQVCFMIHERENWAIHVEKDNVQRNADVTQLYVKLSTLSVSWLGVSCHLRTHITFLSSPCYVSGCFSHAESSVWQAPKSPGLHETWLACQTAVSFSFWLCLTVPFLSAHPSGNYILSLSSFSSLSMSSWH